MKRRNAKNYPVHKQIYTQAINDAADNRVRDHESNQATGEVINRRGGGCDEKMKKQAERCRLNSARGCCGATNRATGN